jgi:hypothetical protein
MKSPFSVINERERSIESKKLGEFSMSPKAFN